MSTLQSRIFLAAASVAGLLAVSGCASVAGGSPAPVSADAPVGQSLGSLMPGLPDGRVIGVGTVMDVAGDVQLCLGAVAESYPPQCTGVPIDDWTWDGIEGSETSGDTRWGAYAVYATYDGERLTRTDDPIMLALYDPIAPPDLTGGVKGKTAAAELTRIQDELDTRLTDNLVGVSVDQGYVWLDVVWDDGTWQKAADEDFGDDVVIVRSALREIDN